MIDDIQPLKIIYIIGAGRSGSTLLDIILGSHQDAVSGGELINAFHAVENINEYCACGKPAGDCVFWEKVFESWTDIAGENWQEELSRLKKKFESLLRFPILILSKFFKTGDYLHYKSLHKGFYQSVAKVSGKRIIVDSSKNPLRAYSLSDMDGVDTYFIHLVRDGRGVVYSLLKGFQKDPKKGLQKDLKPKPVYQTAVLWVIINTFAKLLNQGKTGEHYILLRYEDLSTSFDLEMNRLEEFLGLDYTGIINLIKGDKELEIGHLIAGNRLRMSKTVSLKPDFSWKNKLPEREKTIFWLIAGFMARGFNYRRAE